MKVSPETRRQLRERRAVAKMAKADAEWGRGVFKIFYRDYVFRGSSRPTGFKFCLRSADRCHAHGIVFGPLKNILAVIPDPPASWDLPMEWSEKPIKAMGTCMDPTGYHTMFNDPPEPACHGDVLARKAEQS